MTQNESWLTTSLGIEEALQWLKLPKGLTQDKDTDRDWHGRSNVRAPRPRLREEAETELGPGLRMRCPAATALCRRNGLHAVEATFLRLAVIPNVGAELL